MDRKAHLKFCLVIGVCISVSIASVHAQSKDLKLGNPSKATAVDQVPVAQNPAAPLELLTPVEHRAVEDPSVRIFRVNPAVSQRFQAANHTAQDAQLSMSGTSPLPLSSYRVTGPDTTFLVNQRAIAVPDLVFYRGEQSDTQFFLAVSADPEIPSQGYFRSGREAYDLTSKLEGLRDGEIAMVKSLPLRPGEAHWPTAPTCGVVDPMAPGVPSPAVAPGIRVRRDVNDLTFTQPRQIELAVDTDSEFWHLFNNTDAAAAYVVTLIGAVSDIYLRDLDLYFKLTSVRLYDSDVLEPDYMSKPDPLEYLDFNGLNFDLGLFMSGRRDFSYGGIAFVNALGANQGTAVTGYLTGALVNAGVGFQGSWDLTVVAHELGHNCGAWHTQAWIHEIDHCDDGEHRRGTIMSYCHINNGGDANLDQRFHVRIQQQIKQEIAIQFLNVVSPDCNLNGTDDILDIAEGVSADINANSVPDECEDCNGNGQLDELDLSAGSLDLNANNIPDECEADCDANGIPDDLDIAQAEGQCVDQDHYVNSFCPDENGNNVPDWCETDCDGDGLADYNQIQENMQLDINRNTILDICEDCDYDGTTDDVELQGAFNFWLVSTDPAHLLSEYHAATGAWIRDAEPGHLSNPQNIVLSPVGTLLVTSRDDDRIVEFDPTDGHYLGDFIPSGYGGLTDPRGMTVGPNGNLFVLTPSSILEYDGADGTFVRAFATQGLTDPQQLVFGPGGDVFVTQAQEVLRFEGTTGLSLGVFANEPDVYNYRGLIFKPDGNLLVAARGLLEFDGTTGSYIRYFGIAGSNVASSWSLRLSPHGKIYLSGRNDSGLRIFQFDHNGYLLRYPIRGNPVVDGEGLGFVVLPGIGSDCNMNLLPDACDADIDPDNGIPDACDLDCNSNGIADVFDLKPHGDSLDFNGNGIPDECDIADGFAEDCDGNSIIDEFDSLIDCNANGIQDGCDIAEGLSEDVDANGIPDECYTIHRVPEDFASIQVAVDTAEAGDTVLVSPGNYDVSQLQLKSRILLKSTFGPRATILNSVRGSTVVRLHESIGSQSDSIIDGFTIRGGGAGIETDRSIVIRNCIITENRTGGIKADSGPALCRIVLENCLIAGNSTASRFGANGAAIDVRGYNSSLSVRNCTITNNTGFLASIGGVYIAGTRFAHEIYNSVIWDNVSTSTFNAGVQIIVDVSIDPLAISYSDVQGGADAIYAQVEEDWVWGPGNIDMNPKFKSAPRPGTFATADYHLRSDSLCIDAGDPEYRVNPKETDIDGDVRIRDGRIDMGADEFAEDCNDNGLSDRMDILIGKSFDCNDNGVPDECDLTPSDSREPVSEDCNVNGIPDECEIAPCVQCDLNDDGKINEEDQALMSSCSSEPDPDVCRAADLNGDGKINDLDTQLFDQCLVDNALENTIRR